MARIFIVSDVHYAGPREQRHGPHYEFAKVKPSLAKMAATLYRDLIWMRNPLGNNALLDEFCSHAGRADLVVANGDYTCDVSGFGVSDDEGRESVLLCLGKLSGHFGARLQVIMGDHELGKISLLGDHGGLRFNSWLRATMDCSLQPFWRVELGRYVLIGVTSTLLGLPLFRADAMEVEWPAWERLRADHLVEVRAAFESLQARQRVLLFCHDPSALAYLWQEDVVRAKARQIEHTVVGHLHTNLLLWKARLLAGMPPVGFLGVSVKRMTTGLNGARCWKHFNVLLCPSLAGIQLMRGGGFLVLDLDETGTRALRVERHAMRRKTARASA